MYEPFQALRDRIADWFAPASEASTAGDAYEIDIELPGVKADDVNVSMDGDSLTVSGKKHSERTEEGRTFFFSEREYGAFQRTFRLPPDANTDAVSAEYSDGVLRLSVPKQKRKEASGKRIEIRKV
jgi:HSP20 family protein